MDTVRALPYDLPPVGNTWFFGQAYMARISKRDAARLCGGTAPRLGYEIAVKSAAVTIRGNSWPVYLWVQNISGSYFLACSSDTRDRWPGLFGIAVVERAP